MFMLSDGLTQCLVQNFCGIRCRMVKTSQILCLFLCLKEILLIYLFIYLFLFSFRVIVLQLWLLNALFSQFLFLIS